MSSESIRAVVLREFQAVRADAAAPFEDERFLAFLTAPPAAGKRPADTFVGRRRYVRLLEAVEQACGVCFTKQEWEHAPPGLADFVALVEAKAAKPKVARRLADDRAATAKRRLPSDLLKFAIITSPLIGFTLYLRASLLALAPLGLWLAILALIAWVDIAEYRHYAALSRRLSSVTA